MAAKKKEARTWRSPEEKQAAVAAWHAARATDPSLSLKAYAKSSGVSDTLLHRWTKGKGLGNPGRQNGAPSPIRSRAAQPGGAWLAQHGAALREQMGVTAAKEGAEIAATLVSSSSSPESSSPESPSPGSEAPKTKRKYVRKSDPFLPRQVAITRPNEPRQPELPFPVAHARREEPPEQQEFMRRVTEQALKERDAFKTVLEVFMRDNGLKFPGQ